jgi:zinc transport system ATP-binding protein
VALLKIKGVSFSYSKEKVLKNITFSVQKGEFVAIIGPNGGGKSTLVKLIMGELKPDSGEIKLFGEEPKDVASRVGYVPQNTDVNLNFPIRVIDVVMMGNLNKHNTHRTLLDRVLPFRYSEGEKRCAFSTLEKVGMEEFLYRNIGELSGGQRQRVMIARALCSHPEILILDEPTSSIDIEGQKQIFSLLKELNQEITILVVSHDIATIANYSNKIIYINRESFYHDLSENPLNIETKEGEHFCQVEMIQMLGADGDRGVKL